MRFGIRTVAVGALLVVVLSGCAKKSEEITSSYVSPLAYKGYDCDMLSTEYSRVLSKFNEITKKQDDIASNDSAAMAVGLILFWPALFFIDNDDLREEVASLKGTVDAVEQAAISKKCSQLSTQLTEDKAKAEKEANAKTGAEAAQTRTQ